MKQLIMMGITVFAFFSLLIFLYQRHLIYFPSQKIPHIKPYAQFKLQEVKIQTKDGLSLRSWYKPVSSKHQPIILYLHGNAGTIENRMFLAKQWILEGFGLFLLEYRGFGGNKGQPSEQGLYEDARAALSFLHQNGALSKQIVLYGESLGSGVAIQLAVEDNFCALVLQSAYTSLPDLAKFHYPWLWMKPRDRFDSIKKISKNRTPLLMLHAKNDSIVPFSQAQRLFQQAGEPKRFISFEEVDHNTIWNATDFTKHITAFIRKHCCIN